jgi:hypothetical protein
MRTAPEAATSGTHAVVVPRPGGILERVALAEPRAWTPPSGPARGRTALAAAHVVADPLRASIADTDAIDWDATMAVRRHLWAWGMGVAEAMDTAQRGGALIWPVARELIARTAREAAACGGRVVAGVATDHLEPGRPHDLPGIVDAYLEQLDAVETAGAQPVIMASRHLRQAAAHTDDYLAVYEQVLARARRPVILHWLGGAFDPHLAGYWGSDTVSAAAETVLTLIQAHPERVDGIKLSLLDADLEISMRRRLPAGVSMYTGDDWHYPELIRGDEHGHSDALLGVFDAIAPAAATALAALDRDDRDGYDAAFTPTLPLARTLFEPPTGYYKTGVTFLAWLNGQQEHFRMLGGLESGRSMEHLGHVLEQASAAGLLSDPDRAAWCWRALLAQAGVR